MKKLNLLLLAALAVITFGCKDDDNGPDNPLPEPTPSNQVVVQGNITSNTTWESGKTYLLKGKIYVQSPAVLTIPAGTKIFGDKASQATLIINRGAKIMAEGTASSPIIFTSNAPVGYRNRGDWGGIVILGKATNNKSTDVTIEGVTGTSGDDGKHGGSDDADNSGKLKFVRIEFAGIPLADDNELNSLTMGSVGSGTEISNVMVSYANDDAFEWFGGTVNASYLIATSTWDDDFDTDLGYRGKVQFGYIQRDPDFADKSGSRAFECSGNKDNAAATPASAPKFANVTVAGPLVYTNYSSTSNYNGNYRAAIEMNEGTRVEIYNSLIMGFPTSAQYNTSSAAGAVVLSDIFFIHNGTTSLSGTNANATTTNLTFGGNGLAIANSLVDLYAGVDTAKANRKNNATATASALNFTNPVPVLKSTSALTSGAPSLTAKGFTASPAYYGAFGSAADAGWNWTSGWINFDPINAAY
ncbi:MAG: T9SS C-terminal target domain-containing protein [Cytophagaceae bacterium]|nr:T9SS C-terminal target domain-containing protein [Cytophagaceae bacterium]